MLRGPQTIGELRGHGARLYTFTSLDEVDATVNALITHDPDPMVVRLTRQPGQKEARFSHLLAGVPAEEIASDTPAPRPGSSRHGDRERIEQLEQAVTALTEEVHTLKKQFGEFKKQFE
jgi:uncharacterized protein YceH (UPF0502 family)